VLSTTDHGKLVIVAFSSLFDYVAEKARVLAYKAHPPVAKKEGQSHR